jgi:hypothetical protein
MHGLNRRTSVTKDEAVAILLGWATGPIQLSHRNPNPTEEEEALLEGLTFSLADEIESLQNNAKRILEEAISDKKSAAVIEKLHTDLQTHIEEARLANTYLCAINDELNKGEQSRLRTDKALTNSAYTYLTLTSLNEWKQGSFGLSVSEPVESSIVIADTKSEKPAVRRKMRDQEDAILRVISSLGYTPASLPTRETGKSGVKAQVRKELAKAPFFSSTKSFDKAWERLRKDGSIAEMT